MNTTLKPITLTIPLRPVDQEIAGAWRYLCRRYNVELVYGAPLFAETPAAASWWPGGGRIVVRPTLTNAQQLAAIALCFRYFTDKDHDRQELADALELVSKS